MVENEIVWLKIEILLPYIQTIKN